MVCKTAELVAKKHGVSVRTIMYDTKYARAIDWLNEIHPGIRKDLLTKLIKSTRKETIAVAEYDRDEVAAALAGAIDLKLVLDHLRKKDKLKKGATVAPKSENGSMKFTLDRCVVPKSKPRVKNGHAYQPNRYQEWLDDAIADLRDQHGNFDPYDRAEVSIELMGTHRGDLDNLGGSIMDAMLQSGIIADKIGAVIKLTIAYRQSSSPSVTISIDVPLGYTDRKLSH